MKSTIVILFAITASVANCQESTLTTGESASNSNGSISFSVGQTNYENSSNSIGSYSQGVQQPYEYYVLDITAHDVSLSVTLYPNPASNYVVIEFGDNQMLNCTFQLTDMTGRILQKGNLESPKTLVNLESLLPSTYFIEVKTTNNQTKTYQITKN